MYIDIHNHGLYAVDDGAPGIEESVGMLQEAQRQGAEAVILTPHYRRGMFEYPREKIERHFAALQKCAAENCIGLYLGCEYHVDSEITEQFRRGRCRTLADGDYVLTEYAENTEYAYMTSHTEHLIACGYIPVIAHVERYNVLRKKPELCAELARQGAMIQVNADSILGREGYSTTRFCKKLLKCGWVDIVASDSHGISKRPNHMKECQTYVARKYGEAYANELFYRNPKRILEK